MSRYDYDGGWAPYVPVERRRREAERMVAKLRKAGRPITPVTIAGRQIATTFWGRAWCDMMESFRDYESRLPRGRTYVRNGSVIDLQIAPGKVTAMVSGSEIYDVVVTIKEAAKPQWRAICADCAGGIDSLVELLQGRFSKGVMERLCRQAGGLFPQPSEIRFSCSCPDHASMCKHVAAVLYGVGARLDAKPELLFRLRAVDESELVAGIDAALPLSKTALVAGRVLQADDMSALFGLDMAAEAPAIDVPAGKAGARGPATGKRTPVRTPSAGAAPAMSAAAPRKSAARAGNRNTAPSTVAAKTKGSSARGRPPQPAAAAKAAKAREPAQKPVKWW